MWEFFKKNKKKKEKMDDFDWGKLTMGNHLGAFPNNVSGTIYNLTGATTTSTTSGTDPFTYAKDTNAPTSAAHDYLTNLFYIIHREFNYETGKFLNKYVEIKKGIQYITKDHKSNLDIFLIAKEPMGFFNRLIEIANIERPKILTGEYLLNKNESYSEFQKEQSLLNNLYYAFIEHSNPVEHILFSKEERIELVTMGTNLNKKINYFISGNEGDYNIGRGLFI